MRSTTRPSILLDARKLHDYGIGTYIQSLCAGLADIAPDIDFKVLTSPSRASTSGIPPGWGEVPVSYGLYSLGEHFRLGSRVKRLDPAVFHATHFTVPRDPHVPTVVTIHDIIPLMFPKLFNAAKRAYASYMIGHALKTSRITLTTSHTTRKALLERFRVPDARIEVIPLGVSPEFFIGEERGVRAADFSKAFGIDRPYILFVGNPKPHKGIDVLMKAFAIIHDKHPDVMLVLAGGAAAEAGSKGMEDRWMADHSGALRMVGRLNSSQLISAYAGAEMFVFPSRYEGFGLPVLESMAARTPVVCSDGGALAEVAGDAALITPVGDVDALADALLTMISDTALRKRYIAKGLERAKSYSWTTTAQRTLDCYMQSMDMA